MPKMKTRKAYKRRVKVTARGKIMRKHPGSGHLKSRKNPSRLRRMRKSVELPKQFLKQTIIMLGA